MSAWQHPWLDVSAAPLLRQHFPREASDADLISFITATETYMAAHPAPFAWVSDVSHLVHATAYQRKLFAEFEKRTAAHDRVHCLGAAIVLNNPVTRAILSAVYWAAPPVYPYKIFARAEEAEDWAREKLAGHQGTKP
ncbi:MAG: hypothetical protein ABIJ09_18250 [Pseudomonadota bacterium]